MSQSTSGRPQEDGGGALADLVHQRGRYYFGAAMNILRDAAAAEDACQQALLKAWRDRANVHERGALHAWVLRIVVNESLQVLRRRKTERRVLGRIGPGDAAHTGGGEGWALREAVIEALATLDEPTRTIVSLRIIQGLSGNEVKAMLGCSASEVSRRLHEGMDQLRPLLAQWQAGATDAGDAGSAGGSGASGGSGAGR